MKEYIVKEDIQDKLLRMIAPEVIEKDKKNSEEMISELGKGLYIATLTIDNSETVTKVDICREFAEELKRYIPESVTYNGEPCHLWWRINLVLTEMENEE